MYVLNIYSIEYLLCLEANASSSFLQTHINLAQQRLKFSHFEGSEIIQNQPSNTKTVSEMWPLLTKKPYLKGL